MGGLSFLDVPFFADSQILAVFFFIDSIIVICCQLICYVEVPVELAPPISGRVVNDMIARSAS